MQRKNKKTNSVGLLLALVALLFFTVAMIVMLRSCNDKNEPVPVATPTQELSPSAQPPQLSPAQTPKPTATSAPSPAPSPSPSPTPTPESSPSPKPEPLPVPVSAAGSFASDTKTLMNIVVEWSAQTEPDGNATLEVVLSLDSMSLDISSIYNGAVLTINGEQYIFTTPAISLDTNESTKSELCRVSVKLPYAEGGISVPIEAVWKFNGVYSKVEFESVSAAGEAHIA